MISGFLYIYNAVGLILFNPIYILKNRKSLTKSAKYLRVELKILRDTRQQSLTFSNLDMFKNNLIGIFHIWPYSCGGQ